jgi:polyisoprenoid-binding protein YceI
MMIAAVCPIWHVDASRSRLAFSVKHTVVAMTSGHFARWNASLAWNPDDPCHSSVRVSIETASIDTNLPERDVHLCDLFDVTRFPTAAFSSTRIRHTTRDFEVTGNLTLHGVTHEVTLDAAASVIKNDLIVFDATTVLQRKRFGLQWNAALELSSGVSDNIALDIHLEARRM